MTDASVPHPPATAPLHPTVQSLRSLEIFSSLSDNALTTLAERVTEVQIAAGGILIKQGEIGDSMFVLRTGKLQVFVEGDSGQAVLVGHVSPGSPVGEMPMLLGGLRSATVKAGVDSTLVALPRTALDELGEHSREVMALLVGIVDSRLKRNQLASALRSLVGAIDEAVLNEFDAKAEWVKIESGKTLFKQGDPPDAWYMVTSGLLQVVYTHPNGREELFKQLGHGESVGEMSMLTEDPRSASLHAIRDTELLKISRADFKDIMMRFPSVLMAITKTLVKRLATRDVKSKRGRMQVAVVAASPNVPLARVTEQLVKALSDMAPTLRLNPEELHRTHVVLNAAKLPDSHPNWLRFSSWLEERADKFPFIIFEADPTLTSWTKRCVRQADHVIIVANANESPALSDVERALFPDKEDVKHRSKRTLILLHQEDERLPTRTRAWLDVRHVDAHRHVRINEPSDIERVARLLTDRGVGLVLGGGGARGFAHIGVIKALREAKVPIDMVGGTSMGAIMAGQCAMGLSIDEMIELNARIAETKPFTEYTVPMVALLASKRIEQSARMSFGETMIEDTWINCFAVSSNLSTAEMMVHDSGPLWYATRASGALPGIIVPVVMGDHLLVDGGIINNLPGDVMRQRCGGRVIAVNVSPEEDLTVSDDGIPDAWRLFWNRMAPYKPRINSPSITDILMRTIVLGSAHRTRQVMKDADLYLRSPIDKFGMLEFESLEQIVEAGYRHAQEQLATFKWNVD